MVLRENHRRMNILRVQLERNIIFIYIFLKKLDACVFFYYYSYDWVYDGKKIGL